MIRNLLLAVLLLAYLCKSQLNLESQYCSLKINTTGQIVLEISQNTVGRTQTQFLLKTQTYQKNGDLISLGFFQDQGSLKIEQSSSTLTSIFHEDGTDNILLYIDSLNQYIIAKQITDQSNGQFHYILLTATLGTAGNMTKLTISSSTDTLDNDISALNLVKILDLIDGHLIVLLSGNQQTSIYKINTVVQGNLILQGHLSTSQKINIVGGNVHYIFSADQDVVYISSQPSESDYQGYTYEQLGVQNIKSSANLSIQRLRDLTLAFTSKDGLTKFYPVQLDLSASPVVSELNGTFSSYTDNYQNFLAVTTSDFIWYRVSGSTFSVKKLSNSKLNSTEKADLLTILNLASSISFDGQSALIVTQEASQATGSVYSVLFDPSATKEFNVVNSFQNVINLETDAASNLIQPSSINGYITSISCNCISPTIERFECYSNALKCITVSGSKRQSCNKA